MGTRIEIMPGHQHIFVFKKNNKVCKKCSTTTKRTLRCAVSGCKATKVEKGGCRCA